MRGLVHTWHLGLQDLSPSQMAHLWTLVHQEPRLQHTSLYRRYLVPKSPWSNKQWREQMMRASGAKYSQFENYTQVRCMKEGLFIFTPLVSNQELLIKLLWSRPASVLRGSQPFRANMQLSKRLNDWDRSPLTEACTKGPRSIGHIVSLHPKEGTI